MLKYTQTKQKKIIIKYEEETKHRRRIKIMRFSVMFSMKRDADDYWHLFSFRSLEINNINPFAIEQRLCILQNRKQAKFSKPKTHSVDYYDDITCTFFCVLLRLRSPWSWKWYTYHNNETWSLVFFLFAKILVVSLCCLSFFFGADIFLCRKEKLRKVKKKRKQTYTHTLKNSKMDTLNE